jgi:hypothetical protein
MVSSRVCIFVGELLSSSENPCLGVPNLSMIVCPLTFFVNVVNNNLC